MILGQLTMGARQAKNAPLPPYLQLIVKDKEDGTVLEMIIGFHSPEIFDVLFLCWLVWVSLYLFSIFWCIYFPLETKTDNEVSFIQRLQKSWFFCIFLKKNKSLSAWNDWTGNWPLCIEQDLHNCRASLPRQLFWQISTEFLLDNFFTSGIFDIF